MKDKIIISRPTGEVIEKKVICHFKTVDATYPNIKGIPILIVDKNESNNGNTVLEFFWDKDGLYQAINDDAAWSEVKNVIISIIKNNFTISDGNSSTGLVLVDLDRVNANVGSGKNLGLSPVQCDSLASNFKNKLNEYQNSLNTVMSVLPSPSVNEVSNAPDLGTMNAPTPNLESVSEPALYNPMAQMDNVVVNNSINEVTKENNVVNNEIGENVISSPVVDEVNNVVSNEPVVNDGVNNVINETVVNEGVNNSIISPVTDNVTPISETASSDSNVIMPFSPSVPVIEDVISSSNNEGQSEGVNAPINDLVTPAPEINDVVIEPVNNATPAMFDPMAPIVSPVVNEVVNESVSNPVGDVVSSEPVVNTLDAPSSPEIVPENNKTEMDMLKEEIEKATNEYKEKVMNIINVYEQKINESLKQANEYKERAEEHLKNAQAAEEIAEIARQNSLKAQNMFEEVQ